MSTEPFPEFSRVRLRRDITQEGRRRLDNDAWEDFSETMPAGSRGAVVHIYDDGAAYEVEFFDAGQTIGCFTVPHDDLESINACPKLSMTDHPTPAMRSAILCPLVRYNEAHAGPENHRPLAILVSDPTTNEIVGGLWGSTANHFLHVDLLFVPNELRRAGLGRRLMQDAEEEARRRGCCGVWLDTYSFQAREFYERLGYRVFGTLNDYPPGHSRFFLTKSLQGR